MPPTPPSTAADAYPLDITFEDMIADNRRNTVLLVLAMGGLIVGVAVIIAAAVMFWGAGFVTWQGVALGAAVGVGITLIATLWSYYRGGQAILRMNGARQITREEDPQLWNVVEELTIAGGLPMPAVYMIDTMAMNAFATGRDPEHASVAITRGLRERLERDELQAVMAHELAHVRHLDIRLTMMVATLVGLTVVAADGARNSLYYSGRTGLGGSGYRSRGRSSEGGGNAAGAIILIVVLLVLLIVVPLLATIIQFAISRQREYLADAGAVQLTRDPRAMIDALKKLGGDPVEMPHANRGTQHLWIVNPLLKAHHQQELSSVFSTHPPLGERIARLEALLR